MGRKHRRPLNREMGEKLLKLFESVSEWTPIEVPLDAISGLGLVRPQETVSIWISGSCSNPQLAQAVSATAGIDVLSLESKPKLDKNEPSGNAYHYILQQINNEKFPFMLHGPFETGTIISHWYNAADLDVYLKHSR